MSGAGGLGGGGLAGYYAQPQQFAFAPATQGYILPACKLLHPLFQHAIIPLSSDTIPSTKYVARTRLPIPRRIVRSFHPLWTATHPAFKELPSSPSWLQLSSPHTHSPVPVTSTSTSITTPPSTHPPSPIRILSSFAGRSLYSLSKPGQMRAGIQMKPHIGFLTAYRFHFHWKEEVLGLKECAREGGWWRDLGFGGMWIGACGLT